MTGINFKTRSQGQLVSVVYHQGAMVPFIMRGTRILYKKDAVELPQTLIRMVTDATGDWMEIGFLSDKVLEGSATDGWTDPGHYCVLELQNSFDLVTWLNGNFIAAPSGGVVDNGNGTWYYWSRSIAPKYLKNVLVDYDLKSTRGNKSITALTLHGASISLPNFPYVVTTSMAQLQTDLRAAGYTNAIATYSAAAYTAEIRRHYLYTDDQGITGAMIASYAVTHSGDTVTEVRIVETDTVVSLPGYPYSLPSQAAQLQADLVAAGQSGAVVRLFSGEWRIYLPDRTTAVAQSLRSFKATFTINDQYPRWSDTNAYQGLINDNTAEVGYTNLREASGGTIADGAGKQFARLRITKGDRYE